MSGLRLVHRRNNGHRQQEPHGCQYNPRDEFRRKRGIVEGLALDRFGGPDGLMLLFSMIAERELPLQGLIELAKRVHIPGYEAVSELAHDAVSEGVIAPCISSGFYLQCEIWDVLECRKAELQRRVVMLSTRIGGPFRTKFRRVLVSLIYVLFVSVYCTARGDQI